MKTFGKKLLSMFLVMALVLGMVATMPISAFAAEEETKVLAEELEGYNRILPKDFESFSNERLGNSFTLGNAGKSNYVGNYNGKNYLDVDVNFGEASTAHYLRYLGNRASTSIYHGAFTLRLYADQYGENFVEFGYQDMDTKLNTVVPTQTLKASDYGIESASSDFNVKILTDIRGSAEDESKEVITYQFWLNDMFVCEGSFEETAHERMGVCAQITAGKTLAIKTPGEKQEEVVVDPFAGYERITLADYNTTLNSTLTASLANAAQLTHQGEAGFNGTYIDVDLNYNGNVGWNTNMVRFYASDRYKDSYNLAWETTGQLIIWRYDNAQAHTILGRVKNIADFGISGPSDWFNAKLKIDAKVNASDATKQTVYLELYLNDKLAFTYTVEEVNAAATRNKIFVNTSSSISARVPMDVQEELKGYTPITLNDYDGTKTVEDGNFVTSLANGGSINAPFTDFNKTYLDVDVNFNGTFGQRGSSNIRYQSSGKWTDNYALGWTSETTLDFFNYRNGSTVVALNANIVAADYGISGPSDWFNVKIATDIDVDATNANLQTVKLQLWLNDKLAYTGTHTETRNGASRASIYCSVYGGNTISLRSATPTMEEALGGYTPITLDEYDCNMNIRGEVSPAHGSHMTYQGTGSLSKTYVDMDVNYNGNVNYSNFMFRFYASDKYKDSYNLSWETAEQLIITRYDNAQGFTTLARVKNLGDYGITGPSDWFNVKLTFDITPNATDATKQFVKLQLWLNNKLAWASIIEEVNAASNRNKIFANANGGTVTLRSPRIIEEQLEGYTRVTLEDVEGLGAARAEEGTTYVSAKAGKYVGGNLDKTYLDMDVQSTAGCFLTYLMSENTFWGADRYQFELTGTNLKITPVYGGTGQSAVTLGLGSLGYTEGEMFNLKIRTDISGTTVVMQFWYNDSYVAKLTFTEPAVRTMKYMGIRGTGTGATVVRMPAVGTVREEVSYDLSKGAYLLTGADYFYVNGKKMPSGTALAAPNDYVIERIVDGKIADSKLVSLYYLGDVNLDGSAFESGDPVWKDSHALKGIVDYGTPMKAAMKAADMNNDGKVTEEDHDIIVQIRSDVAKKDEILSKYHTDSLSYDFLGGKDVMPIGGFYGPYSDATITDGIFQLIKDSGINLITYTPANADNDGNRVQQALALAEKYGIGMFVSDAGLNVIEKDENGNVTGHTVVTSLEELAANMDAYSNYDSFLGINIVDEPKGADDWGTHSEYADTFYKRYNYYSQLAQALKPYANITGYINMHGSQSVDDGKFYDYASKIGADVDVLSFDTYLYFEDNEYPLLKINRLLSYLESLDTIRQISIEQDKPFWSFVQAGSDYRDDGSDAATAGYYTEADTLWIVNTSLAFGAKGIQYFPLLQPAYFSYDSTSATGHDYDRNGIIGANNEANRNYAMVQKANKQIAAIDHVLMNAQSAGVIVTGQAKTDVSTAALGRNHTFTGMLNRGTTYTEMLNNVSGGDAMVGCFNYQGYEAYYVVNYSRTNSQTITLSLNDNAKYYTIADAVKTTGQGSSIALTVPAGAGVLVVLETLHTHSHGDWVVTTPATLAAVGQKEKTCVCGHKITEEIPKLAAVNEYGVTLRDDLSMNFKMDVDESIKDTAQVVITVGNKTTTQSVKEVVSVNVTAIQMNDTITVQVVNGADKSEEQTFTVLEYAQSVLADEDLSEYHQMAKEMLNYGGYAQTYFGYNTDNLANEGLNPEEVGKEEVPQEDVPVEIEGAVEGISAYGASLVFRNKIAVRYYFKVTGDAANYTFKANGVTYNPVVTTENVYIEVPGINPQDLENTITVTVNDTLSFSYSPMTYIVRMSQKGTENMRPLMKALYNYYLAAEALTAAQ